MKNKQCPNCGSYKTYSVNQGIMAMCFIMLFTAILIPILPIVGVVTTLIFALYTVSLVVKRGRYVCTNCKYEW